MATINAALINEQRKYPRYNIEIPATIRLKDGLRLDGKTGNISSNGALFEYENVSQIEPDTHCILTLYNEKSVYPEEIKIKCVFKPHKEGGVGLQFITMSTHDFINFVFLLSNSSPDPEKTLNELKDNPGIELLDE